MKHTCCCGASIEVSSMHVTTERIEWDRFNKDHEGCKPKQRERVAFVPMYTVQCDSAGRAESLVFTKCDMCHLPLAFCRCRRRCATESLADYHDAAYTCMYCGQRFTTGTNHRCGDAFNPAYDYLALKKTCVECGGIFTLADIHTCGKCYTNFAKAYAKLASDDDGFEAWWEREIHNKDSYFYASMGNCHEHHRIWTAAQEAKK